MLDGNKQEMKPYLQDRTITSDLRIFYMPTTSEDLETP